MASGCGIRLRVHYDLHRRCVLAATYQLINVVFNDKIPPTPEDPSPGVASGTPLSDECGHSSITRTPESCYIVPSHCNSLKCLQEASEFVWVCLEMSRGQ